jgi:hypothetical protein
MRIVKLGPEEFPDEHKLLGYFEQELPARTPPGLFLFKSRIAKDELDPGETVLFCHDAKLRFVAEAATGRMDNTYLRQAEYPHCLVLKLPARRANAPLAEVESRLRAEAGLQKSLQGQAWTRFPDSERAKQVIDSFILP